jgi:hypothetical protein
MARAAMLLARVIPGTPMWVASMAVDPDGTLKLQEQFVKGLAHIVENPGDALGNMIDLKDLRSGDIAKWAGHLTPDVIVTVLTWGGGGAAAAAGEGVVKTAAEATAEEAATTVAEDAAKTTAEDAAKAAVEGADKAAVESAGKASAETTPEQMDADQADRAAEMGGGKPLSAPLPGGPVLAPDGPPLGELLGRTGSPNPVEDLPRVGSALKVDAPGRGVGPGEFTQTPLAHGFPDIVDNYAGLAQSSPLQNGAMLYQLSGSLAGVEGRFEWIIDKGAVTHRMFVRAGTINGIPVLP